MIEDTQKAFKGMLPSGGKSFAGLALVMGLLLTMQVNAVASEGSFVVAITRDGRTVGQAAAEGDTVADVLQKAGISLEMLEVTSEPMQDPVQQNDCIRIEDGCQVTVQWDGNSVQQVVPKGTVADVLDSMQISLGQWDRVSPALEQEIGQGTAIAVDRAFPVTIQCDGESRTHMFTGGSVAEMLASAGITLGELDQVDAPLEQAVNRDDVVTVERRELATWEESEELPFETLVQPSINVEPGSRTVQQAGKAGQRVQTWSQLKIEGEAVEDPQLVSDEIRSEPVTELILVGFPAPPVSKLDFGCTFTEQFEPVGYKSVIRGQRAAGYSAGSGAKTASGLPAVVGHVAVNPNVIPYGSKLFIRSTDSKFIYGYAIAADTGTALMQGTIAVDLFYDNYAASARNGIKTVDIFVLE